MKKTQSLKLINLFLLSFPFLLFSQDFRDKNISKEVWELSIKPFASNEELYNNGEKMLKLAKTDEDRANAYRHMGDAKKKMMEFSTAIELLNKGDYYAKKSNFLSDRLMINFLLYHTYRELGMAESSNKTWNIVLEVAKKINDPEIYIMIYEKEAISIEEDSNYQKALKYRLKIVSLCKNLLQKQKKITEKDNVYYSIFLDNVSYDYLKCNKIDSASIYFAKADSLIKDIKEENHFLIENHYLCKAIILSKENSKQKAIYWFGKAYEKAKKKNNKNLLKIISEESLINNIKFTNNENTKSFIELNKNKENEISKFAAEEINHKNVQLEKADTHKNLWIMSFLAIIIIIIIILNYYYTKRKKQLEKQFNKIIGELEYKKSFQKSEETINNNFHNKNSKLDPKPKIVKIISKAKETELLQKLSVFEKSEDYTAKNFTIASLASILGTNVKYTNHIIKVHRNKNFNEYINSLKVILIAERLYNDPKYLKYKVNSLSEIAGFSSQSRFAEAFKKEFQMTPSVFIQQLIENKK